MNSINQEQIEIIKRQTDYNEDQINLLLKKYNNNIESVIKHYLNDGKIENENRNEQKNKKSLNQRIFSEIRDYMDDIMDKYNKRKNNDNTNIVNSNTNSKI